MKSEPKSGRNSEARATALLCLDPGMQNVAATSELLKPCDAELMRCYPVSGRVNHVANDDEECSKPVELAETQNRLFS